MKPPRPLWIRSLAGLGLTLAAWEASAQGLSGVTRQIKISPAPGLFLNVTSPPAPRVIVVEVVDPAVAAARRAEADRKALQFQQQKADEGFSYAQYELGLRYLSGNGVERDEAKAREWLTRAATNGHTQAKGKLRELAAPPPRSREAPPERH